MNINRVVENKRAARMIDMETTNAMGIVCEQVRVREVTQVVRALAHLDEMREAGYELHQAWRLAIQRSRIVQHHTDSAQVIVRQKSDQGVKTEFMVQLQAAKIAIEDQYFMFRPRQDGIAGLAIFGFTGE